MNKHRKLLYVALLLIFMTGCGDRESEKEPLEEGMQASAGEEFYQPSPEDGMGSAVLEPDDDVRINTFGTWKITYTAEGTGVREGGGLVLHISPWWGWTPPQTTYPEESGYVRVKASAPGVHLEAFSNMELHWIKVIVEDTDLKAGETITLTYGDTQDGLYPAAQAKCDKFAEEGEEFFIKVDGDGDGYFVPIKQQPVINISAEDASDLVVFAPSLVDVGEPFSATVAAIDYNQNRATSFEGDVKLVCLKKGLAFDPDVAFTAGDRGAKEVPVTATKAGVFHLIVVLKEKDIATKSNPILVGSPHFREKLYWGDIHGHTGLSDGTGTPDAYYQYARDVSGLQVAAVTDHDALGLIPLDESLEIWEQLKQASRQYNQPGAFVTFPGYEYTNFTTGHKHVLFFDEAEGDIVSYRHPETDVPTELWEALRGKKVMTISHHPGGGPAAQNWDYHDPGMEPVVEITSIHGHSEYFGAPQGIYSPEQGSFVQDALAKGYRFGFVGSGDTHNGHPGMGDPGALTSGIAGFFAGELTREGIWEALQERKVYATSGDRIILGFWIGETMMGQIHNPEKETPVTMKVYAVGKFSIERVDIVKNNEDIYSEFFRGKEEILLNFSDKSPPRHGDFYYARITQQNGTMAWSSPIWIEP